MTRVIKRNGSSVQYCRQNIYNAVSAANADCSSPMNEDDIEDVVSKVEDEVLSAGYSMNVEDIQDIVEETLMAQWPTVSKAYIIYRYKRELARQSASLDERILSIVNCNNEEVKQENSNKNPVIIATQRDYLAGELSKDIAKRKLYASDLVEAHNNSEIHIHDLDYALNHSHNCDLVNLEDMLQNGTRISGTTIDRPKTFSVACNVAMQIVAQVSSNQYGGQTISLAHLSPFVESTRSRYRKMLSEGMYGKQLDEMVENLTLDDIKKGVQCLQYQAITLLTTNGQAAFVSIQMYINEVPEGPQRDDLILVIKEVLRQRIQGVKNEKGMWVSPAFPKLLYVLTENNYKKGTKYWDVTELAAECTAKRMVPDYISEKKMLELKGDVYPCMGCRSFLTPDPDNHKYYGRFNQGVCTVNLPYVALKSLQDDDWTMDSFWNQLDDSCEKCFRALMTRHEWLEGTPSDVAPILWQDGALARLGQGEVIDHLLHGGYSTISLGYSGLWECVIALIGKKLTDPDGKALGVEIMKFLNKKTLEWRGRHDIHFSLYGTPMESTTYTFAKALKKFSTIKDVNDHNYITNSYHINVREDIDAFSKLSFESEFQELSPGGAISYVEVPNLQQNLPVVYSLLEHMYNNIMYSEINIKSDYCQVCDSTLDMQLVEIDGKLTWKCPVCSNTDFNKLNVARRVCGYVSTNEMNQGRLAEIRERKLHL